MAALHPPIQRQGQISIDQDFFEIRAVWGRLGPFRIWDRGWTAVHRADFRAGTAGSPICCPPKSGPVFRFSGPFWAVLGRFGPFWTILPWTLPPWRKGCSHLRAPSTRGPLEADSARPGRGEIVPGAGQTLRSAPTEAEVTSPNAIQSLYSYGGGVLCGVARGKCH